MLKALQILKGEFSGSNFFDLELFQKSDINYEKELIRQAIEELEQYEQKFKDKEFKYRTECQNVLSAGRVEADNMPDRLAELEKVILDYYLGKGYQVGVGHWNFNVEIDSLYKSKTLKVKFVDYEKEIDSFECKIEVETTKEMFDKAIEFFRSGK